MVIRPLVMLNGSIIAIVCGFILTWIFDSFNEIIKMIPRKSKVILTGIIDFISIVAYVILLILVLYYNNEGINRGIYSISIIIGLAIYYILFSKVLRKITRIILYPIYILIKFVYDFIRKIYLFLLHTIEKIFRKLYNKIKSCEL